MRCSLGRLGRPQRAMSAALPGAPRFDPVRLYGGQGEASNPRACLAGLTRFDRGLDRLVHHDRSRAPVGVKTKGTVVRDVPEPVVSVRTSSQTSLRGLAYSGFVEGASRVAAGSIRFW